MAGNSATNTVNVIGGTTANPTIRQIKTLGETALGGQDHEDAILGANAFIYTNDGIRFTDKPSTASVVHQGTTYNLFEGNNLAFGRNTATYGVGSIAIGRNSAAANYGISLGNSNTVYDGYIAIGNGINIAKGFGFGKNLFSSSSSTTERCLLGFFNSTANDWDKVVISNGYATTESPVLHNVITIPEHNQGKNILIDHDGDIELNCNGILWGLTPLRIQGGSLQLMPDRASGANIDIYNNSHYSNLNINQQSNASTINIGDRNSNSVIRVLPLGNDSTVAIGNNTTNVKIGMGSTASSSSILIGNHAHTSNLSIMTSATNSDLFIGNTMNGTSKIKIGNNSTLNEFKIGENASANLEIGNNLKGNLQIGGNISGTYGNPAYIGIGQGGTYNSCRIMNGSMNSTVRIGCDIQSNSANKPSVMYIGYESDFNSFVIGSFSTQLSTPTIYTKGYRSTGHGSASTVANGNNDYLENILKDIDARLTALEG